MSSEETSSPVSASTLVYLMRWPVLRLIWLNETFSVSEVAGYSATGQVTSESRRKPFQLARGAMTNSGDATQDRIEDNTDKAGFKQAGGRNPATALTVGRRDGHADTPEAPRMGCRHGRWHQSLTPVLVSSGPGASRLLTGFRFDGRRG